MTPYKETFLEERKSYSLPLATSAPPTRLTATVSQVRRWRLTCLHGVISQKCLLGEIILATGFLCGVWMRVGRASNSLVGAVNKCHAVYSSMTTLVQVESGNCITPDQLKGVEKHSCPLLVVLPLNRDSHQVQNR